MLLLLLLVSVTNTDLSSASSFAFLEMTSCLSKIFYKYDLKLVNKDLDWEASSKCYVMWWKAPVNVLFEERDYK